MDLRSGVCAHVAAAERLTAHAQLPPRRGTQLPDTWPASPCIAEAARTNYVSWLQARSHAIHIESMHEVDGAVFGSLG